MDTRVKIRYTERKSIEGRILEMKAIMENMATKKQRGREKSRMRRRRERTSTRVKIKFRREPVK